MEIKEFTKKNLELTKVQNYATVDFKRKLKKNLKKLVNLQEKLYADAKYGVVIIIQAMDTAGKDGVIKHVMTAFNPQGTKVESFKQPTSNELKHDYLWRANSKLPERGQIGIFNRSYYEEMLVVKVHDLVHNQNIPEELITNNIWDIRYRQINDYEKYLSENGFKVIKIFLNISKEEQKKRLLERIDDKLKNWKFSEADLKERGYWEDYMKAYKELLNKTKNWYVVPSDNKKHSRYIVSEILVQELEKLNLEFPELDKKQVDALEDCKKRLLEE